jgi:hypothetical protein
MPVNFKEVIIRNIRSGKTSQLHSYDSDSKTITINTDKGLKELKLASAAGYMIVNNPNVPESPINLGIILKLIASQAEVIDVEIVSHTEPQLEAPWEYDEAKKDEDGNRVELVVELVAPTTSVKADVNNTNLVYIPDLAGISGIAERPLRKKLRKLEAENRIQKTGHVWAWEKDSTEWKAILEMVTSKK